jgi:hypothetical protein
MWKANGKTTTLQLFLDSLSPKNMRDASSGDKVKVALFGELESVWKRLWTCRETDKYLIEFC